MTTNSDLKPFSKVLMGLLVILLLGVFLIRPDKTPDKSELHITIIPHFMLESEKVKEFYSFIKDKRYQKSDPDNIIIISPNHFHPDSQQPQTICTTSNTFFKTIQLPLTPFFQTSCEEKNFFPFGNIITTNEHGIGEHFRWIESNFSNTKNIYPLILPTHKFNQLEKLANQFSIFRGETLIITSVDFSHYLSETQAYTNDQTSITTLQNWTSTRKEFRNLDVDCPSCLYLIHQIANNNQQPNLYRRDSSSTILGRDMKEENTSRIFMYYE